MRKIAILWLFVSLTLAYSSPETPLKDDDLSNLAPLEKPQKDTIPTQIKDSDSQSKIPISKNLSIKADAFIVEGNSSFEMETQKANLNEIEAPFSRYGAEVGLNYKVVPRENVGIEFFVSNGIELNFQRRGGKVKAYDEVIQYENNAYYYGNRVIYPAWVNSIGFAISVLKAHNIRFVLRQMQISSTDLSRIQSAAGIIQQGAAILSQVGSAFNTSAPSTISGLYVYTTQIFIIYTYRF